MSEVTAFTVVCAYQPREGAPEPRLFYDCTRARTAAIAATNVLAKCPGKPFDILVFPGELCDKTPDEGRTT